MINSDDSERSQSDESDGSFSEFSESSIDESMIHSSVSKKRKKPTKVKSKAKTKADSEWVPIEEFIPDFDVKYKGSKASYENYSSKHELPVAYFKHFLNDKVFGELADSSNSYSIIKTGISANITKQEMEQYIGKINIFCLFKTSF